MASITIRNLDDDVKTRLRIRAAGYGRSMEEEVRLILREAVERADGQPISRVPFVPALRPWAVWSSKFLYANPYASHRGSIETAAMIVLTQMGAGLTGKS